MTVHVLREGGTRHRVRVVGDGEDALAFLHRRGRYAVAPRPDLILLDLNLPRVDGRDVLAGVVPQRELDSKRLHSAVGYPGATACRGVRSPDACGVVLMPCCTNPANRTASLRLGSGHRDSESDVDSLVLDTVIGIVFVFATFGLLISLLTELIARFMGMRGEYLMRGLRSLVDENPTFRLQWRDLLTLP